MAEPLTTDAELRIAKRQARELKTTLEELSAATSEFLRLLDGVMRQPSTPERGKQVAHLSNTLEVANDRARFFQLGVDYRKDKKQPVPPEKLAKWESDRLKLAAWPKLVEALRKALPYIPLSAAEGSLPVEFQVDAALALAEQAEKGET